MNILLIIFPLVLFSQNRILVNGKLLGEDISLLEISVYNTHSFKGVITNKLGEFHIKVKQNDVLYISSIEIKEIKYTVSKKDILSKKILIPVFAKVNLLPEIVVNSHNLSGNLYVDRKKIPKEFEKYRHYKISLKNKNFGNPGTTVNPEDFKLPDPLRNSESVNSIDLIPIIKMITSGIIRKHKLKKIREFEIANTPIKVRKEFGDLFFVKELKIPKPLIEDFLNYCHQKNKLQLFNENKKLQLIDVLIKESKIYKKNLR